MITDVAMIEYIDQGSGEELPAATGPGQQFGADQPVHGLLPVRQYQVCPNHKGNIV